MMYLMENFLGKVLFVPNQSSIVSQHFILFLIRIIVHKLQLTVGLDGDGVTTGVLDHLDGFLGGTLGTGVVDNDLLALLAKLDGDGPAQTAGTAGNEDDLGIVGHHLEGGGAGGRSGNGRAGSKGRVGREGRSRGGSGGKCKKRGEELHCCCLGESDTRSQIIMQECNDESRAVALSRVAGSSIVAVTKNTYVF